MGLIAIWAMYYSKVNNIMTLPIYKNVYLLLWLVIWIAIAALRLVDNGIGGTDALAYSMYFKRCFDISGFEGTPLELYDSNLAFKWYNQIIRVFTANESVFFALTHGIMALSIIWFVKVYYFKRESFIPLFLIVFWYLRGFCTIRSNFATVFLLIGLIFLLRNDMKKVMLFALLAFLFHKAMALYVLFIPFYLYVKKHKVSIFRIFVLIFCLSIMGTIIRDYVFGSNLFGSEFNEHYAVYSRSDNDANGFVSNFWKIAFEQMLLGVFMLISKKKISYFRTMCLSTYEQKSFDLLWYMCVFDILMIPICSVFVIWRGYEFFYIPRLVMWGIIIWLYHPKTIRFRPIYNIVVFLLFLVWFIQRIHSESFWKESCLMPYIFSPFYN